MTAGREIAGFAVPFAVGVALSATLPSSPYHPHPHATISILLAAVAIFMILLLRSPKTEYSDTFLWFVIIISAMCCGALCPMISDWLAISHPSGDNRMLTHMDAFGAGLRESIASLPFKNDQTNALMNSLITGNRSDLDHHTKETFRQSGASHILALSGMHLGIIYGILKSVLIPLGNSRRVKILKSWLILSACLSYAVMTGAGPSIVRAFLFIMSYEIAGMTGRSCKIGEVLMTSLVIQLTLCPEDIREVGFQLSYAAMAGIAFIYPTLNRMWPADSKGIMQKGLRWIWSSASMSIACQLTTGPIAFAYFGTFPRYFILTNLMAAPLVGFIIPWSLTVLLLSSAGFCPQFLITGLESTIQLLIRILENISSL